MCRPGTKPVGAVLAAALVGSLAVAAAAYGRPAATTAPTGADRAQAATPRCCAAGIARGSGLSLRSPDRSPRSASSSSAGRSTSSPATTAPTAGSCAWFRATRGCPTPPRRPRGAAARRTAACWRRSARPEARRSSSRAPPLGPRLGYVSGSASRTSLTDGSAAGTSSASCPMTTCRGAGGEPHPGVLRARRRHHRRPGGVRRRALRRRSSGSCGPAASTSRGSRSTSGPRRTSTPSWRGSATRRSCTSRGRSRRRRSSSASSSAPTARTRRCSAPTDCSIRRRSRSGAYVSFFPVNPDVEQSSRRTAKPRRQGRRLRAPTYVATQVIAHAVDRACRNGQATRAEVGGPDQATNVAARASLLGFPVRFTRNGDLRAPATFGIYRRRQRRVHARRLTEITASAILRGPTTRCRRAADDSAGARSPLVEACRC